MKDVILFTGQSNMQGQTGMLPRRNRPIPLAEEYRYLTDSLVPLRHPVGENISENGTEGRGDLTDALLAAWQGCGSLIPYFCGAYSRKSRRKVVAVQAAKGSTTIGYWQKGGKAYSVLADKFAAAVAAVGQKNLGKRYAVFLQGESDMFAGTGADEYARLLRTFGTDLRRDLGLDAFFVLRAARFANDERDFPVLIAQEKVCKEDGYFQMLYRSAGNLLKEKRYLSYEPGHFNNAAFAKMGAISGRNAARYTAGKKFCAGYEPYRELRYMDDARFEK